VKRKILAAFILAVLAIVMALSITNFYFKEMMVSVDELSAPNEKLTRLNKVFEEITTLDQQQRAEALENPEKPYKYFLDQSGYIRMMIDSLQFFSWDDPQLERLQSLQQLLDKRNNLFVSYLKVKAELADNHEFSTQLDTLSSLLHESQRQENSIVTTQRKTTKTYLETDSSKLAKADKGFLKKLFSRKKSKAGAIPEVKVREELNVTVDTVAMPGQGLDFEEVRKAIRELETDQRSQRAKLQGKELELVHANNVFISQLLNTLHEVENEEVFNMRATNSRASQVVNKGIARMSILVVGFSLAAAFLMYLIFIDISKSNFYRKQLEKARDEAEELSKIKQRFLANMSHEIRTPLQSIIGFAEQLKQRHNSDIESVDAIYSSSEHLLQIVNEVLDYSRISSGNFILAKEKFNLLEMVREVEAALKIQADIKKLSFIVDLGQASEFTLMGDSFRLRQILYNLLGNAIKFTSKGFVKLVIKTFDEGQFVQVVVDVKDSGIGMSPDDLKKVFNQFEQANVEIARNFGGTGLGLTIVKALVDVQNGRLEVDSEPGVGSMFKVSLRYEKVGRDHKVSVPASNLPVTRTATKVYVVDDDSMILKLCSLILRKNAVQHVTFNNALNVLAVQPDRDVSHIFIDIRMPGMSGNELCEKLKVIYPQSKFIALTAHVLPDEQQGVLQHGFDMILTKPFHEGDLLNAIGVRPGSAVAVETMPDFKVVRQMTMGDDSLFQSVIQQFVEESESDIEKLSRYLQARNAIEIREVIHKLSGRFAQMGIQQIASGFRALEEKLENGVGLVDLDPDIATIKAQAFALIHQIRAAVIV
jgi:signal transduction histidine kinase/ActR/RegA family two-component response regulator